MAQILVQLSVDEANNQISFKLTPEDNRRFNEIDAEDYFRRKNDRDRAKENKEKRDHGQTVGFDQRVHTDDYTGEPPTAHAGIHLSFENQDEIVWFSDQEINFVIDVGPDPELILIDKKDGQYAKDPIRHADKMASKDPASNPFERKFPLLCVNGQRVGTGRLRNDDKVKKQRYYKYTVTVMDTTIVLDPHFEGHDPF